MQLSIGNKKYQEVCPAPAPPPLKKKKKTANIPHFFVFFANLHKYFAGKTYIFVNAWPMYNKVKTNIGLNCQLCVVNNFYTHLATKHAF